MNKLETDLLRVSLCIFVFGLLGLSSLLANPYVDFLPRYRKAETRTIITKIVYEEKAEMVIHFRYVAALDKEHHRFFGPEHDLAWSLVGTLRPREGALRICHTENIRINNLLRAERLLGGNLLELELNRGDVLSCELRVKRLPEHIKSFNLRAGERDWPEESGTWACMDVQVKTETAVLGQVEDMYRLIERFYENDCKYVRHPDIKDCTSLEQEALFKERKQAMQKKQDTPLQASLQTAYMPKTFERLEDIVCQERFILEHIHFNDDSGDYTHRQKANKVIAQLVLYLQRYPQSKMVLHGHTDIHGDAYRNLRLSKERVLTIKRSLLDRGISANRIIVLYHGGSQPLPLYPNGGSMNRRVEMEVICSEALDNTSLEVNGY